MHREGHDVEDPHRIAALVGEERDPAGAHLILHIGPRRVDALAPDALDAVEAVDEDAHAEVGHADFIRVGKAEGDAHVHVGEVLHDAVCLAARIAPGLLDVGDKAAEFFSHTGSLQNTCRYAQGRSRLV